MIKFSRRQRGIFYFASRRMMPKNQLDEVRMSILAEMNHEIKVYFFDKNKIKIKNIYYNNFKPKTYDFCNDFICRYDRNYDLYI